QQERVTPLEEIRPFPKAPPRKTQGGRKKGKTAILTSTPVRKELLSTKEKGSKKPAKRARKRLQTPPPDSDEEDISENMLVQEDSDTPDEEDESLKESFSFKDIKINDYVLVKYDPEDTDTIPFDQFVSKLPRPVPTGGTKRAAKRVKFDFDLRRYF
ncbi:hypothetical protein CAPTEDRAFT_190012, partial [Capitella teleta]